MNTDIEQIELYILNMLTETERAALQLQIEADPALQKIELEHRAFLRLIEHKSSKEFIRNQLALIRTEQPNNLFKITEGLKVHLNKYWKTASVAASVALVASTLTFMVAKENYNKKLDRDIKLLGSNLKRIETKTNAISKKVNAIPVQPIGSGKLFGTAFAVNNKGFVITNEHVVNSGGDIYLFTPDNIGHKCEIISSDKELDIAVLRVDEKDFSFTSSKIPYSFSNSNSSMAQRVYTLGFPKNSIVYNEGYISSVNGNDEDSNRYQMELPSSPGVSGSPVFDEKGNVVALINSKQSISEGITYALKSKKILKFLNSIDELELPTSNSMDNTTRANQIKQLQDFIFVIKVY
jgi:serine protease Do